MSKSMRVKVLVDNCVMKPRLLGEHGFSVGIEIADQRILFDTGEGVALGPNAERMGFSLAGVDHIILSHGHYDHSGGLLTALSQSPGAKVWLHPLALQARYGAVDAGGSEAIGIPNPIRESIERSNNIQLTSSPVEVVPSLFVTGPIPRVAPAQRNCELFLDAQLTTTDLVDDDQALFLRTTTGLVVILGCAHAGVMNTLKYVSELASGERIAAIIGGMHLYGASDEETHEHVEQLKRLDPDLISPGHCTGGRAQLAMAVAFGDRFFQCGAGCQFEFQVAAN